MSTAEQTLASLSPAKRRLFELLKSQRAAAAGYERIAARPDDPGPHPLSPTQERLWFFHQLEPDSAVFNIHFRLALDGDLDRPALAGALRRLVIRHQVLRSRFHIDDSTPRQTVTEARPALPVVDLEALPEPRSAAEAGRLGEAEAARPFDLSVPPLLRAVLIRRAPRRHVLALTVDHVAADGWSIGVVIRELAAFYGARVTGGETGLPELPIQYHDVARWQRDWLAGERLASQVEVWRRRLAPPREVLELPTDRPRPAARGDSGGTWAFPLPDPLAASVRRLAAARGATPFTVLLAGFATLLAGSGGTEDLFVGSPVANRRRVETEGLVGVFINTLVLRCDLSGQPSFAELVDRLREVVTEANAHQDVPFERLVEELAPERDLARTPLFQVMFNMQSDRLPELALPGLDVELLETASRSAEYDLTLMVREDPDGSLRGSFEYATDLFDVTTVGRLARRLTMLLGEVVEAPTTPIARLTGLAPAERHALTQELNDSAAALPGPHTAVELIDERTTALPDAEAVRHRGASLTFGELREAAEALARRLIEAGVVPGDRVGVLLPRSVDMVVAQLAAMKAGAAYAPLDPTYPPERLAHMVSSAGLALVVAWAEDVSHDLAALLDQARVPHLAPRGDAGPVATRAALPRPEPGAAAYLVFTSGSTGRPKAVLVSQRSLAHHCRVLHERYRLGPGDRALQFVSPGFDVAVQEIVPSLAAGATVVLRPMEEAPTIDQLVALVESETLTILNLPTSYWHEWVTEIERGAVGVPESLRLLVVGTEQTRAERWRRWRAQVGVRVRLVNGYGPTEATIESSWYEPRRGVAQPVGTSGGVPIGRPFANSSAHVVDPSGHLAPLGVAGELWVGGVGLAWGYFDRPSLTAERFVPDPFGAEPGGRLYRTGDLARWLASGDLECLGRTDRQVKVRGFRVEPGEIETALASHPAVREVAVVPVSRQGTVVLAAYWTAVVEDGEPSVGGLREFLSQRLPSHMVPGLWQRLDEMPLSAHGKVDRGRLPEIDRDGASAGTPYVAPDCEHERTVARVWASVLGVERVGLNDNFFELGGHSLLMIRVRGALAQAGHEVALVELFRHPTVRSLAGHLGGGDRQRQEQALATRRTRAERRGGALAARRGLRQRRREQRSDGVEAR